MYPEIEPYVSGMLDVGDGNASTGRPAAIRRESPPWSCTVGLARAARRGIAACSIPPPIASCCSISATAAAACRTPAHLRSIWQQHHRPHDRRHRTTARVPAIERWLVLGGSWGSTLALAYAEPHPERVTEMILFGVTTGRHTEMDWLFRGGVSIFFPEQWERLRAARPLANEMAMSSLRTPGCCTTPTAQCGTRRRGGAYGSRPRWPGRRRRAWPSASPIRVRAGVRPHRDALHRAQRLAGGWQPAPRRGALADIPGVLINGRFDFQAPIGNAWALKRAWPRAELWIVDDAGHSADNQEPHQRARPRDGPLRRSTRRKNSQLKPNATLRGSFSCSLWGTTDNEKRYQSWGSRSLIARRHWLGGIGAGEPDEGQRRHQSAARPPRRSDLVPARAARRSPHSIRRA